MPSASRRDAARERVDGELLTVYGGDTLDAAMAAATAGHGAGAAVRKARRVKQGVRGLLGKERYEVLVAGEPLPPPAGPVGARVDSATAAPVDVASALDLLLERADAAEEQAAARRRPAAAGAPAASGPGATGAATRATHVARPAAAGRPAPPVRPRTPVAPPGGTADASGPAPARVDHPADTRPAPDLRGATEPPRSARTPVVDAHPALDIAEHAEQPTQPDPGRPRGAAGDSSRPTQERPQVRPSRYGRRSSDRGGPAEPPPESGFGRRVGDVLDAEVLDEVEEVVGATGRAAPAGPDQPARRRPAPGPQARSRRAASTPAAAPAAPTEPAASAAPTPAAGPAALLAAAQDRAPAPPPPAHVRTTVDPAAGDGWSRAALRALGVPTAVLGRLPVEDPEDDLGWLAALGSAIAAVVPAPASPGPTHPVVVSGHGLEGAVALLEAGVSGVAPGTLTIGDRTVPATAAELALAVRACVLA